MQTHNAGLLLLSPTHGARFAFAPFIVLPDGCSWKCASHPHVRFQGQMWYKPDRGGNSMSGLQRRCWRCQCSMVYLVGGGNQPIVARSSEGQHLSVRCLLHGAYKPWDADPGGCGDVWDERGMREFSSLCSDPVIQTATPPQSPSFFGASLLSLVLPSRVKSVLLSHGLDGILSARMTLDLPLIPWSKLMPMQHCFISNSEGDSGQMGLPFFHNPWSKLMLLHFKFSGDSGYTVQLDIPSMC